MADTNTGADLLDAASALGASMVRVGVTAVTLPLSVLPVPPKTRDDATTAATDLFNAVGALHMGLAKIAVNGFGVATRALTASTEAATNAAKSLTK
jgi:hypothetical protein